MTYMFIVELVQQDLQINVFLGRDHAGPTAVWLLDLLGPGVIGDNPVEE